MRTTYHPSKSLCVFSVSLTRHTWPSEMLRAGQTISVFVSSHFRHPRLIASMFELLGKTPQRRYAGCVPGAHSPPVCFLTEECTQYSLMDGRDNCPPIGQLHLFKTFVVLCPCTPASACHLVFWR